MQPQPPRSIAYEHLPELWLPGNYVVLSTDLTPLHLPFGFVHQFIEVANGQCRRTDIDSAPLKGRAPAWLDSTLSHQDVIKGLYTATGSALDLGALSCWAARRDARVVVSRYCVAHPHVFAVIESFLSDCLVAASGQGVRSLADWRAAIQDWQLTYNAHVLQRARHLH